MEPAIFFADMRLRSIHRPPRRQTENRTVGACVRASPLFSHRGRRGSASHPRPTDEVRLEPISAPRRKRHEGLTPRAPTKSRGPPERAVRDKWVLAHTTDTRSRGRVRGTGDRTVQRGTARGELIARVELPGPSLIREDERSGRDSHVAVTCAGKCPRRAPSRNRARGPVRLSPLPGNEVLNNRGLCLVPTSNKDVLSSRRRPQGHFPLSAGRKQDDA